MQHAYDLLVQARTAGEPVDLGPLVAALSGQGAQVSAEGVGAWRLSAGELTIAPVREGGALQALAFAVPFHETTELFDTAVKALTALAEQTQTRVMDPQRGEEVRVGFSGDEYLRMARYAGEYGGVSSALGLSTWATPPVEDTSSVRWLLVGLVFAIALYSGWRTVVVWRESRAADAAEDAAKSPRPMNVAPKVPGK